MPRFRVELAWRYRKKRAGVILGMTIEAPNATAAIKRAKDRHIRRHPSRVFLRATAALTDGNA